MDRLYRKTIRYLFLIFIVAVANRMEAAVKIVYAYNTEFSINLPGQAIVPAVITQGDSILWQWVQGGHTTTAVVGSPEQWDQPINSSNQQFYRQFNTPGVFWYYCIPHGNDNGDGTASGMASTITVLPAGSGACCLSDGSCITTSEGDCLTMNGYFTGVGTLCDTISCLVSVSVDAALDNILYESTTGALSNALGQHLYAGNNNSGKRRTVISFDLSEVPANAEVQQASLKLFCNSSAGSPQYITARRLLEAWGEGTSEANGNEGNGDSSTPGDATWIHTFYDTAIWTVAGGDFASTVSDSTLVDASGVYYTWSSEQLAEDVQLWIDTPVINYGWILFGDENSSSNTKRFSSRQSMTTENRPSLLIDYIIPPTGACCFPDASCLSLSENHCSEQGGIYLGDGVACGDNTCPIELTPFIDELPVPAVMAPEDGMAGGVAHYRVLMTEQFQSLHSELPPTRTWGYNGSYPGPTIEAFRDSLVTVEWINDLRVEETGELRTSHVFTIDTCLHGPDVTGQTPVAIVHLHGGKVPHESDGYPDDAFPPGDSSWLYFYPNIQAAATLWYHDHGLGITRLNVMMGLAGFYLLRDLEEEALNLPSGEYEIPLAIQDRSFNADGSFAYPDTYHDHFFGDKILVNGKVWPFCEVKQGKYRFRLLNGSNSRVYKLALSNGSSFNQVASDLGLLATPVELDSLVMLPGERCDIIIDFSSYPAGTEIILTNDAPAPYPGFPGVGVIPNVMKFIVQAETGFTGVLPDTLVPVPQLNPDDADLERLFYLTMIPSPHCNGQGHPMWTINDLMWDDITEYPVLGSTEIWTWHNQSGISHPMHMHLVRFQLLDRQAINEATGLPEGPLIPPGESEKGWKDTVHSPPGYRTRVMATFSGYTGKFPYHCHILEHEDHEMMRQFEVLPCNLVTTAFDSIPGSLRYALNCVLPGDTIFFAADLVSDTLLLEGPLAIDKDVHIINLNDSVINIKETFPVDHALIIHSGNQVELVNFALLPVNGSTGRSIYNEGHLILDSIILWDDITYSMNGSLLLNAGLLDIRNTCSIMIQSD